nr:helix-turn-helix domain-containing protein [Streptomyces sp. WAC05950]
MPRPERPLDPDSGPQTRFAADLRKLREAAGRPPYRALAKRAHYSSTTLSDAAGGHTFPSLAVTLAYVEACQGDRRAWETRWHTVAAEIAATATAHAEEPAAAGRQTAPYAGLSAFQPEDADRFFGREQLTGELLAKVRGHRFLTVFGPSGSGKSSLLRAGLIARTRATGRPAILLTPGPHPVQECAIHLAAATGEAPGPLVSELLGDPTALHLRIRQAMIDHPSESTRCSWSTSSRRSSPSAPTRTNATRSSPCWSRPPRRRPAGPAWCSAYAPTSTPTASRTPGSSRRCARRRSRSDR